jgi:hypothetical protein
VSPPGTQSSLAIRTTCVRGISSATKRKLPGRLSIGKTTPEKKNIGVNKPVKKKLK